MADKEYLVILNDDDITRIKEGDYIEVEVVCEDLMDQVARFEENSKALTQAVKGQLEDLFHDTIMPALSEDFAYASDAEAQAAIDFFAALVKSIPVVGIRNQGDADE
jgi:hypothetical protein